MRRTKETLTQRLKMLEEKRQGLIKCKPYSFDVMLINLKIEKALYRLHNKLYSKIA